MVGHATIRLSKMLLHGHHLRPCHLRGTVQTGHKLPFIGLAPAAHIGQHRFQGIPLAGRLRFVLILDIAQDVTYVALNGPDFCGGHGQYLPFAGNSKSAVLTLKSKCTIMAMVMLL